MNITLAARAALPVARTAGQLALKHAVPVALDGAKMYGQAVALTSASMVGLAIGGLAIKGGLELAKRTPGAARATVRFCKKATKKVALQAAEAATSKEEVYYYIAREVIAKRYPGISEIDLDMMAMQTMQRRMQDDLDAQDGDAAQAA